MGKENTQSNDQPGQADALLAQGLAHQGKGELVQAAAEFEQALKLYQQQHRPLGIAQTRSAAVPLLSFGHISERRTANEAMPHEVIA